ncbi:hypothetical protein [Priestia megaterium]|uniref:hypothetical protein n=1 Tax=Priestia megaterium TaxID=1404 RepID=UPI002E214DFC|nr:hypothetical protein [Priestia megaterium]
MVGGQGEDSCGKSGTNETPQERKRRGGSSSARGKRSLARKANSGGTSIPGYLSRLFVFRLHSFRYGPISFLDR